MTAHQQMIVRFRKRRTRAAALRAEGKTWAQIGRLLNCSRQRAQQLAAAAP